MLNITETDTTVVYPAVGSDDVSNGQTTIRTRKLRYSWAVHPVYRHYARLS